MLLSGGTTSLSKLIPRTHDDYVLNARLCAQAAGFDRDTVFMAVLPLGHNYNLASPGMLGAFYCGGTVVLAPAHRRRRRVLDWSQRERVTVDRGGRAADLQLAQRRRRRSATTCRRCEIVQNGGARLPPELRGRLRERLRLHPAGDLRHRRRPDQHDAASTTPTSCCCTAPVRRSAS